MITLGYIDPGTGFTIFSIGGGIIAFIVSAFGVFVLFFKKIWKFIKNHKKITGVLSIIVVLFVIIGVMLMNGNELTFNRKIIILGFDGLSPDIVELLIEQGKLPHFAELQKKGSYRHLVTTNPAQSPVAWTGFSTGKNPAKNGIFDFIVRDPKTYTLSLSLSKMVYGKPQGVVKAKTFWQYTSDVKVPAIVISAPVTFPPDKLYGKMLSGMGVPDILGTEGTFTFYTSDDVMNSNDIGGKVFHVRKSGLMIMNLIGPRIAGIKGTSDYVKVPFKAVPGRESAVIEYQKKKVELKTGEWSDWQEVSFDLGFFKKAKGIFKFYLVETEPAFKLYISPVNFDPRAPLFPVSYPRRYSKELADAIGLFHTQGMPDDTWAVNEKRLSEKPFLEQMNAILTKKREILDYELNRFQKGVFFCYFGSSDIIQHMFWRYRDPEHPLYEKDAPAEYREAIYQWYMKMDEILGEVLSQVGDEDTIIVLSDHGFNTERREAHINSWLKANGYLYLKNPYAETGGELLSDIDWSKTKAYSLGFGAVYLNQKNREKHGIVNAGDETESLKKEISQKLLAWNDEKYKQRVINNVYAREQIFSGKYFNEMPDLFLGFNVGYCSSWQTALGAVPPALLDDNLKKWSGSHLFDPVLVPGIILSNRIITKQNPSIYDITPTILSVIGYDAEEIKECDFDGRVLW